VYIFREFYLFNSDVQGNVRRFNPRSIHICVLFSRERHLVGAGTNIPTRTMPKSRDDRRLFWHRRSHQQYCRPRELETRMKCLQ